ncbi:MAG: hypothetical protein OXU81_02975 [Gammaproteobacteria bacterium]|nr:hypothetical protein [Gammaproteobacteria bacterium]
MRDVRRCPQTGTGSSLERRFKDVPVRLDYCFVSAGLKDRIRTVRVDSDAVGSDHQPVWMDIDL